MGEKVWGVKFASFKYVYLLNRCYIYTVRVNVYVSVEGRPGLSWDVLASAVHLLKLERYEED